MNQAQRDLVRQQAKRLHHAFHEAGDHASQRVCEIALAALDYADAYHVADANHFAGDHDSCDAPHFLEVLEKLLGGPEIQS